MPVIHRWFDTQKEMPWERMTESPWSENQGAPFHTYPLTWLLPYVEVTKSDLEGAPLPLWITDISPENPIGKVCEDQEGTFVIPLPETFDEYLSTLSAKTRKKFRALLRASEDIEIRHDQTSDIDVLWGEYTERLQTLAVRAGGEHYTEEELSVRRAFYAGSRIRTMSFLCEGELQAVNVSMWEEGVVYDLACLMRSDEKAKARSYGSLAILKNVELAISEKMTTYDLLSCDYGYKRSYGAHEVKLKAVIVCSPEFAKEYKISPGMWVTDRENL